jgi:tRNA(fMet)-specific endonuclease VapC
MPRSGSSSERLVLDTSAYSHFREGHSQATDWIAAAATVLVPTIVIGELEAGFRLGSREKENRHALSEFLAETFVVVVPVTAEVSHDYGLTFARLRRRGTPIPINDIWIAACTRVASGLLLTFDRDFESVPELRCVVLAA